MRYLVIPSALQSRSPLPELPPRDGVRRRGSALVYLTAALVALLGFASLGVDVGRVLLVRSELQLAADAAGRYAAAGFKDGITASENNAIAAAGDNTADGTAVALDRNQDIEFGTWNATSKTFTPLSGTARAGADAVRVTARRTAARGNPVQLMLAGAVGRGTFDARAVSVVRIGTAPRGFIGTSEFVVGNNALIASYDPAIGAPGGGNVSSDAIVGSNSEVDVGSNTALRGDVRAPDFNSGNGSTLTGQLYDNDPTITLPATESPTVPSSGSLNVSSNTTLPAGTYNYSSVTISDSATLTFSGAATVYVTGNITLDNNATLAGAGDNPGALRLRMAGGGAFQAGNNATLIAHLYAPAPVPDVKFGNNAHVRGSIAARVVGFGNNAVLYFDPTTGGTGSDVTILD